MIEFRQDTNFHVNARKLIQGNEGFKPNIYDDSSGLPTIGYGYALVFKNKDKNTGAIVVSVHGV